MSATATKDKRLQARLDELRSLLDENGVAPSTSAAPDTIRLVRSLSYYGLKWSDAVHHVGGRTYKEARDAYCHAPLEELIDQLRALAIDGCKPRRRKRRNGSPEPQATLEAPTAPDTGYRGEFKQCRNCYWHDGNGYCPALRGRCYKAPHKLVDYGTFKQQEEVTA